MAMLSGKTIVLGVTGSIAAYKTPELVRRLRERGAQVEVILTRAGTELVSVHALEVVSGLPVHSELFPTHQQLEPFHIDLAGRADVLLIAPASADIIGKLAHGICDDLVTSTVVATTAPVVIAPAMNVHMWHHEVVQRNVKRLARRGHWIVQPGSGGLACGEEGVGRLADLEEIISTVEQVLVGTGRLEGKMVLVTAGPTQEAIDPVRYISNRSSGRMGYALARMAQRWGAHAVLVAGPVVLEDPVGVEMIKVRSAAEMEQEVLVRTPEADVVIMAAAVADYRPVTPAPSKLKRGTNGLTLKLEATPDILAAAAQRRKPGAVMVGFALDTGDCVEKAFRKLQKKGVDLIVANDPTVEGAGFEVETNVVTLVDKHKTVRPLPKMTKAQVAEIVMDWVCQQLEAGESTRGGPGDDS
jgi:phosphopantothenoylcysteine decarboxylase/phosphopantothenate--cysteine ligase